MRAKCRLCVTRGGLALTPLLTARKLLLAERAEAAFGPKDNNPNYVGPRLGPKKSLTVLYRTSPSSSPGRVGSFRWRVGLYNEVNTAYLFMRARGVLCVTRSCLVLKLYLKWWRREIPQEFVLNYFNPKEKPA